VTFTSAKHRWKPLVETLVTFLRNKASKNDTNTLEDDDIDYLIRKYPVTCSQCYRHRINVLKRMICHDTTFFGKISDYYFITEFQNRGTEHEHGLYG